MQMLDRQRVQQAAADEAKKLVDAAALAAQRLVDATKEAEETATHPHAASGWRIHCGVEVTELSTNKQHSLSAATAAAALSPPEEAQVSLSGSTATAAC